MSDDRISFERKNLVVRTLLLVLVMGLAILASLLYILSYPVTKVKIYNAETGAFIDEMIVRRNSELSYIKTVEEPQGYTFQYYTFEDGTEFYPGMIMDKEVVNVYAVFTANYYTATYYVQYTNADGVIGYRTDVAGCEPITYQYSTKFNLPTGRVAGNLLDVFTSVRGKTFVGWTTTLITDENEDSIKPLVPGSEQIILGDVNYYAVFAKNSYNVVLHTGNDYVTSDGEELRVDDNGNPINYPVKDDNGKYIIKNDRIHNEGELVSIRYLDKLSDLTSQYQDITLSEELDGIGAEEYDFMGWYLDEDYKYKASDYNIDVYVDDNKMPYLRYTINGEEKSYPARIIGTEEDGSPLYAFDLYSKWERRSYNIIFDKNTNKSSGRVEKVQVYKYDDNYGKYYNQGDGSSLFGVSNFTRSGQANGDYYNYINLNTEEITSTYFRNSYKNYRFMGWATNSNPEANPGDTTWYCRYVLNNETPNDEYRHLISSDITLYAQWSRIYTITFAENSNTYSTRTYTKQGVTGETIPLDGSDYVTNTLGWTKTYYSFAGWTSSLTSANPEVEKYEGSSDYNYKIQGKNITLYVIWKYIPYKASFMANYTSDDQTKYSYDGYSDLRGGSLVKFPSTTPTREGYKFEGWSAYRYSVNEYATLRRSNGTVPDNQAIFTSSSKFTVTGDMVYYACWTIDYVITYDTNFPALANGESQDAQGKVNSLNVDVTYSSKGSNLKISISGIGNKSSLTRKGYDFAGWTIKNADGTINRDFKFNQVSTYVFDFYTYTDPDDASQNVVPCMYSTSNISNKMALYFESGSPSREIKIVAMWTPVEYELTFRNTYTSESKKITMLYTDVFTFDNTFTFDVTPSPTDKLPVATASGRFFEGWALEKDGTPVYGVGTNSEGVKLTEVIYGNGLGGNVTFYSIFSIKPISVIFQIETNEKVDDESDEYRIDSYYSTQLNYGAPITLPKAPSGSRYDSANGAIYSFKNWYYIDGSGNKVVVNNGDAIRYYEEFTEEEKELASNEGLVGKIIIWAQFEAIEYDIEFNFTLPDGTQKREPYKITVLKNVTYSSEMKSLVEGLFEDAIPSGSVETHTFAGFKNDYIANTGYTIVLTEGMAFNTDNFPELIGSPKLTLTPIWNVNDVQIDYVYNNGSEDVIYDGGYLPFDSTDNYQLADSSIFTTNDGHTISRWYITNGSKTIYFELEDYLIGVAYTSMSAFKDYITWDSSINKGNLRIYADVSESIVINYYSHLGLISQQDVKLTNGETSTVISSGQIAEVGDLKFAGWKVGSIASETTWGSNESVDLSTAEYGHSINLYADLSFTLSYMAITSYSSSSTYTLESVASEEVSLFSSTKDSYISSYRIESIIDDVDDYVLDGFTLYGYKCNSDIYSITDITNQGFAIDVDGNNKQVILYIYKNVQVTYTATRGDEQFADGSKEKSYLYPVGYDLNVLTYSGEILVENLIPVKTNYIHIGWKMTNNGVTGSTVYENNSVITLKNLEPITMTAEFKQPDIGTTALKVRFSPVAGSASYIEEQFGNGQTITLKILDDLYAYDSANSTSIWTNSRQVVVSWSYSDVDYDLGVLFTLPIIAEAGDIIEFVANWEATYNIMFTSPIPDAENMPETIRVTNGQKVYIKDVSTPTPPASASSNEFENWYYNNGSEDISLSNTDIVVVDFSAFSYSISYTDDGYAIHTFPANNGNISDFVISSEWGRAKINITMRFYDSSITESSTSSDYGIYIDDEGRGFREYVNSDYYYGDGIADDFSSLRSIIPDAVKADLESNTSAVAGWSKDYDGSIDSGLLSLLTADITVYAIWSSRYKVEYADAVSGDWGYSTDVRTVGYYFPTEVVTVDKNVIKTIIKDGYVTVYYDNGSYTLTGDNYSKYFMLKGFSYDSGSTSFNIDETLSFTMSSKDVTLTPILEEAYIVNFYQNGTESNNCIHTEYRFAGKTVDISQITASRTDASFLGWSEDSGNNNSTIITSTTITITGHTSLYAVWNSDISVKVYFNNTEWLFDITPDGQGALDADTFETTLNNCNTLTVKNIGSESDPVYIYTHSGNLYYLYNITYQRVYYSDIANLCSSVTITSSSSRIVLNFVNVYTVNYYEDTTNTNKIYTDYVIDNNGSNKGGLVTDSSRNGAYIVLNPEDIDFEVIEHKEPTSWKTRDGGYVVNFGTTINNISNLLIQADSTYIINLYVNYTNETFDIYIYYIPSGSNVVDYYLSGASLTLLTSDFAYETTGTKLLSDGSGDNYVTLEYGNTFSVISPDHDDIKSKYADYLSAYYDFVGWTASATKLGENVNFYSANADLHSTEIAINSAFISSAITNEDTGRKEIYLYPVFKEVLMTVSITASAGVFDFSVTNQSLDTNYVSLTDPSSEQALMSKVVYLAWYQTLTVSPTTANANYQFNGFSSDSIGTGEISRVATWDKDLVDLSNKIHLIFAEIEISISLTLDYTNTLKSGTDTSKVTVSGTQLSSSNLTAEIKLNVTDIISIIYEISDYYDVLSIVSGSKTLATNALSGISVKNLENDGNNNSTLIITLSPKTYDINFNLGGGEFTSATLDVSNSTYDGIATSYTLSDTLKIPLGSTITLPDATKSIEGTSDLVALISWSTTDGNKYAGDDYEVTKGITFNANYAGIKQISYFINGNEIYTQLFSSDGVIVGSTDNSDLQSAIESEVGGQYYVSKWKDRFSTTYYDNNSTIATATQSYYYLDAVLVGYDITINYTWTVDGESNSYSVTHKYGDIVLLSEEQLNDAGKTTFESTSYIYGWNIDGEVRASGSEVTDLFPTFNKDTAYTFEVTAVRYAKYSIELHYYYEEAVDGNQIYVGDGADAKALSEQFYLYADENGSVSSSDLKHTISDTKVSSLNSDYIDSYTVYLNSETITENLGIGEVLTLVSPTTADYTYIYHLVASRASGIEQFTVRVTDPTDTTNATIASTYTINISTVAVIGNNLPTFTIGESVDTITWSYKDADVSTTTIDGIDFNSYRLVGYKLSYSGGVINLISFDSKAHNVSGGSNYALTTIWERLYKVTYNDGATDVYSEYQSADATIISQTDFQSKAGVLVKSGYNLVGFVDTLGSEINSASDLDILWPFSGSVTLDKDITLYPAWAKIYTIDVDGTSLITETFGSSFTTISYNTNSDYYNTNKYTFTAYFSGDESTYKVNLYKANVLFQSSDSRLSFTNNYSTEKAFNDKLTADKFQIFDLSGNTSVTEIYAVWSRSKYTVTFQNNALYNDGTTADSTTSKVEVYVGDTISADDYLTLKENTLSKYDFFAFKNITSDTAGSNEFSLTTQIMSPITIYLQYTGVYTVEYTGYSNYTYNGYSSALTTKTEVTTGTAKSSFYVEPKDFEIVDGLAITYWTANGKDNFFDGSTTITLNELAFANKEYVIQLTPYVAGATYEITLNYFASIDDLNNSQLSTKVATLTHGNKIWDGSTSLFDDESFKLADYMTLGGYTCTAIVSEVKGNSTLDSYTVDCIDTIYLAYTETSYSLTIYNGISVYLNGNLNKVNTSNLFNIAYTRNSSGVTVSGTTNTTVAVTQSSTIEVSEQATTGYEFDGWYIKVGNDWYKLSEQMPASPPTITVSTNANNKSVVTLSGFAGNYEIYAVYKEKYYTLTVNISTPDYEYTNAGFSLKVGSANTINYVNAQTTTVSIQEGKTIKLDSYQVRISGVEKYIFNGFAGYVDNTLSLTMTKNLDITLTYDYSPAACATIYFSIMKDGYIGIIADGTYTYTSAQNGIYNYQTTIPAGGTLYSSADKYDVTLNNYIFTGWLARSGGVDGEMSSDYTVSPGDTYYLIAKFTPVTITINYYDNINNTTLSTQSVAYNSTITLPYIVASYTNGSVTYVSYKWEYSSEMNFGDSFTVSTLSNTEISSQQITITAVFQTVYSVSFEYDASLFEVSGSATSGYKLVVNPITIPSGKSYIVATFNGSDYDTNTLTASGATTLYNNNFEIPEFTITQLSTKVFNGWILASAEYSAGDTYTLNTSHDYGADGTIEFTVKEAESIQFRFVMEGQLQAIYTIPNESSTPLEYVSMLVSDSISVPYISLNSNYVVGTYFGQLVVDDTTYYIKPVDGDGDYIDLSKYKFYGWKASASEILDTTVTDIASYYTTNKGSSAFNYTIPGSDNVIGTGNITADLTTLVESGNYSYYTIWEKKKEVTFNFGENVTNSTYVSTNHLVENKDGDDVTSVTYLLAYGDGITYPVITYSDKVFGGFELTIGEASTSYTSGSFILQDCSQASYTLNPVTGAGVHITFNINFAQWTTYFATVTQNSTQSTIQKMPKLWNDSYGIGIDFNSNLVDTAVSITTTPARVSELLNGFTADFTDVYPSGFSDIFTFAGWGSETDSTTAEIGGWSTGDNVTLYAIWQRKTVTVSLHSQTSEYIEGSKATVVSVPWGTQITKVEYSEHPTPPCDFTYLHDLGFGLSTLNLQNNGTIGNEKDETKTFLYWAYKGGIQPLFTNSQVSETYTKETISDYVLDDIIIYPYIVDKYEVQFMNNGEQYGKSSYVLDSSLVTNVYSGFTLPDNTQILMSDIEVIFNKDYVSSAYYMDNSGTKQTFTSNVTFNSSNFMIEGGNNIVKVYVNLKFEATYTIPDYSSNNNTTEEIESYPLLKSAIDVGTAGVTVGDFYSWKYSSSSSENVNTSEFIYNISKVIKSATIELTLSNDKFSAYNLIITYTDNSKETIKLEKVNLYFYAQIVKSYTLTIDSKLSSIAKLSIATNVVSTGNSDMDLSNEKENFYLYESSNKYSIEVTTHYTLSDEYMPIVKVEATGYGVVTILHANATNSTINSYWTNREYSTNGTVDASASGYSLEYTLTSTIDANLNSTNSFRFYGDTAGDSYEVVLSIYTYTVKYQVTAESKNYWQYATNTTGTINYETFDSSKTVDSKGSTGIITTGTTFYIASADYTTIGALSTNFNYYFEYDASTEMYTIVLENVPYGMVLNVVYSENNTDIYGWQSDNEVQIDGFIVTLQSTINTLVDTTIPTDIILYMNMNVDYTIQLLFEVDVADVSGCYWENVIPSSKTVRTTEDGSHYVVEWSYTTTFNMPETTELVDGYNRYDITEFMNNITIEFNNTFNSSYSESDTGIKKMLNYFIYDDIWSSLESEGYLRKDGKHYARFVNGKLILRTLLTKAIVTTIDTNTIDYLTENVVDLDRGNILKDSLVVSNGENIVTKYEYSAGASDYVFDTNGNYKYQVLSSNDNEVIVKSAYNYKLEIQASADSATTNHVAYIIDSVELENCTDQSIGVSIVSDKLTIEYNNANTWSGVCSKLFNKDKSFPVVNAHIIVEATTFDITFTNIYMVDSGDDSYTATISYDTEMPYAYYNVTLSDWYNNPTLGGNDNTTMPLFAGNHTSGKLFCNVLDKDIENKTYGYLYYIFNFWQESGVQAGIDTVIQSSKTYNAYYFDGVYSTESGPLDMVNYHIYDINYNLQDTSRILFNTDSTDMFGYTYSSRLNCVGLYDFFKNYSFNDTAFSSNFVGNTLWVRSYVLRQTYSQNHDDEYVSDLENLQEENNIKYYDVYACLPYFVDREYFVCDDLNYSGSTSQKLFFWAFGGAYTLSQNDNKQLQLASVCTYGIKFDNVAVEINSGKLYADGSLISHLTYSNDTLLIAPIIEVNNRTFAYFKIDVDNSTWASHINSANAGKKGDVYDMTDTLILATSIVYSEHLNVMVNFDTYDNLGQEYIASIEDKIDNDTEMTNSWLSLHSEGFFIAPNGYTTLTSRQYEIRMGGVTDNDTSSDSEENTSTLIIGYKSGATFTQVYVATTQPLSIIQGYGSLSWNIYGVDKDGNETLYGAIAGEDDSYLINDCNNPIIIRLEYPPQAIDVIPDEDNAVYIFDYVRGDMTETLPLTYECEYGYDRIIGVTDAFNATYTYSAIPLDGSATQSVFYVTDANSERRIIANFGDVEWSYITSMVWQWSTDQTSWTTIPADSIVNIIASTDIYVRVVAFWKMVSVTIVDKDSVVYIGGLPIDNAYTAGNVSAIEQMRDEKITKMVDDYVTLSLPLGYNSYSTTIVANSSETISFTNSKHSDYTFTVSTQLGAVDVYTSWGYFGQGMFYSFDSDNGTYTGVTNSFAGNLTENLNIYNWLESCESVLVYVDEHEDNWCNNDEIIPGYGKVKINYFLLKDTARENELGNSDYRGASEGYISEGWGQTNPTNAYPYYRLVYTSIYVGKSSWVTVDIKEDEVVGHKLIGNSYARLGNDDSHIENYASIVRSFPVLFDASETLSEKVFDIPLGGDYEYREFAVYGGDIVEWTVDGDAVTGTVYNYWNNWRSKAISEYTHDITKELLNERKWTFAISFKDSEDNTNTYSQDLVIYPEWGTKIETVMYKQLPYVAKDDPYTLSGGSSITSSGSEIIAGGNSFAFWVVGPDGGGGGIRFVKIKVYPYFNYAGTRLDQYLSISNGLIVAPDGTLITYDSMSDDGEKYFVVNLTESPDYQLGLKSDVLNSLGVLFGQSLSTSFVNGEYKIKELESYHLNSVTLISRYSGNSIEHSYNRAKINPDLDSLDIDSTKYYLDLNVVTRQAIYTSLKTTLSGDSLANDITTGSNLANVNVVSESTLLKYAVQSGTSVNKAIITVTTSADLPKASVLTIKYYRGTTYISGTSYYVSLPSSHYSFASDSYYGWKIATNEGRLGLSLGSSSHDGITYSEYDISTSTNTAIGETVYGAEDLKTGITLSRDFTIILDIVRNPVTIYYEYNNNAIYWNNFSDVDYELYQVLGTYKDSYISKGVSSIVVPGGSIRYECQDEGFILSDLWYSKQGHYGGDYYYLNIDKTIDLSSNPRQLSLWIDGGYDLIWVGKNYQTYNNSDLDDNQGYECSLLDNTTWAFVLVPKNPPDKVVYYFKVDEVVYGPYDFNHNDYTTVTLLYGTSKDSTTISYVGKTSNPGYFNGLSTASYAYENTLISWTGINENWKVLYTLYSDGSETDITYSIVTSSLVYPKSDELDGGEDGEYNRVYFILERPVEEIKYYFHTEVNDTPYVYGPYQFEHPRATVNLFGTYNSSGTLYSTTYFANLVTLTTDSPYYTGLWRTLPSNASDVAGAWTYIIASDVNSFYVRRWKLEYYNGDTVIDELTQIIKLSDVSSLNPADDTYDGGNTEYTSVHFTLIKDYWVTFTSDTKNVNLLANFSFYVPKYGDYTLIDKNGNTLNSYASDVELTTMVCYNPDTGYRTGNTDTHRMFYAMRMPTDTANYVLMGFDSSLGVSYNYYWIENSNNTIFTLMYDEDKMEDGIENYFTFTISDVRQNITLTPQWMQLGYTITYTARTDAYYTDAYENGKSPCYDMTTKYDKYGDNYTDFVVDSNTVNYEYNLLEMPFFIGYGFEYSSDLHPYPYFNKSGHYYGCVWNTYSNGTIGFAKENELGNAKGATIISFYVGHNYTYPYPTTSDDDSGVRGAHNWYNSSSSLSSFCSGSPPHLGVLYIGQSCEFCTLASNMVSETKYYDVFTAYKQYNDTYHKEATFCVECCVLTAYSSQALDSHWYITWSSDFYDLFSDANTKTQKAYRNKFAYGDIVIVTGNYKTKTNSNNDSIYFEHENEGEATCIMNCRCGYYGVIEMDNIKSYEFHKLDHISYEPCSGNCVVDVEGIHYHTDKSIYGYDKGGSVTGNEDSEFISKDYIYVMYEHGLYEDDAGTTRDVHWAYCYSGFVCADCGRMYHTHNANNYSANGYAYNFFEDAEEGSYSFNEITENNLYSDYYYRDKSSYQKSGFGRYATYSYYTSPDNQYSNFYDQGGYSIDVIYYGECCMLNTGDAQNCTQKNGKKCIYCYYSVDGSGTYGPHNYIVYEITRPYNVYKDNKCCSYKLADAHDVIKDYILVCSICKDDAFLEIDAFYVVEGSQVYKTIEHVPFADKFKYKYYSTSNNIEIFKDGVSLGSFVVNNDTLKEKTEGAYCKYCGYEIYLNKDTDGQFVWKSRVGATGNNVSRKIYLYKILDKSETWRGVRDNSILSSYWNDDYESLYLQLTSTIISNNKTMFKTSVPFTYDLNNTRSSQIMGNDISALAQMITQVDILFLKKKLL